MRQGLRTIRKGARTRGSEDAWMPPLRLDGFPPGGRQEAKVSRIPDRDRREQEWSWPPGNSGEPGLRRSCTGHRAGGAPGAAAPPRDEAGRPAGGLPRAWPTDTMGRFRGGKRTVDMILLPRGGLRGAVWG